mgnify:FL=1
MDRLQYRGLVLLGGDLLLTEDRKTILEAAGFSTWQEQEEILDHKARIKLVAGGERAGKSFLGALSVINHLDEYENGDIVWLVARDYERTRAEWNYLTDILGRLGFLVKQTKRIDPGEMTVACGTQEDPGIFTIKTKSANDYRSLAMEAPRMVVACEASQIDYESFLRLRGRIAEKRGYLFLEGTFEMSLGWYPSQWEAWQYFNPDDDAISFSLPSWTNQAVYPEGREDDEILALERLHSEDWFNERVAGKPAPPKGLVHNMFDVQSHISDKAEYIKGEPVHLWIDPGYSQVTKSAYAVEAVQIIGEQVRVIDEVFEREKITEEIIEICQMRPWWPDVQHGVIDIAAHNIGESRPVDTWLEKASLYMQSERVGILDGVERFNTFLKENPVNKQPNIIFNPKVKGVISELGGCANPFDEQIHVYTWRTDREGNTVGREPRDAFNHGIKAITYGLVVNYGYARAVGSTKIITVNRW